MKVVVTGSSGLVGSALVPALETRGHEVTRLVRRTPREGTGEVEWDPESGAINIQDLDRVEAAVHLAGENIASGRWTEQRKARIRESRTRGTELIAGAMARLEPRPRVLVSASAIGYYGNRGDEVLSEESAPGQGFLPEVCLAWEGATLKASQGGVRVVTPRIGVVLSPDGGALGKLLLPFRLGLGGQIGDGRQYMSWIALDDLVSILIRAVEDDSMHGPINAVSPRSVTNAEFTRTLGRVLSRPTVLPMPAFAARMLFGEMADDLLLGSQRVEPARLAAAGFEFEHPDLEGALRHLLGRRR